MLFNSFPFLFVFLPATLAGFIVLIRLVSLRAATAWVVFASLVFYGYWEIAYLPLLAGSILFNYATAKTMMKSSMPARRVICAIGVVGNLSLLAYYKYAHFFGQLLLNALPAENLPFDFAPRELPIGISFYTFLQIAFIVDVYVNKQRYKLLDYSFFVSFFPHLIAGPLLHHREIIPQIRQLASRIISARYIDEFFSPGLALLAVGLAKKMIIANPLGDLANLSFDAAGKAASLSFLEAWGGAAAYGLQIYFDFSAYSDMAIGLGLMFGILLPLNFNSPYQATSIIDFWRRWHITLSRFLRDYLYIPLGGNRRGAARHYINIMITMVLGGLWHGASLTFVLWGAIHGALLVFNHIYRHFFAWRPPVAFAMTITIVVVMFAWVPFRATSFDEVVNFYQAMVGLKGVAIPALYGFIIEPLGPLAKILNIHTGSLYYLDSWRQLLLIAVGFAIAIGFPNASSVVLADRTRNWFVATKCGAFSVGAMIAVSLVAIFLTRQVVFLYFQF